MMKVQVQDRAVIAANSAASAGLLYERPLDLLVSPRDGIGDAALAAESLALPVSVLGVRSHTMAAADPHDRVWIGRRASGLLDDPLRRRWGVTSHERMFAHRPDDTSADPTHSVRRVCQDIDGPPGTRTQIAALKRRALYPLS